MNYENENEIKTKLCITCNIEKPIEKLRGRNCISCRNKKYYKKIKEQKH